MHWHYYNCKGWPELAHPDTRRKTMLADLTTEQYNSVMDTMTCPDVQRQLDFWGRYKQENGNGKLYPGMPYRQKD